MIAKVTNNDKDKPYQSNVYITYAAVIFAHNIYKCTVLDVPLLRKLLKNFIIDKDSYTYIHFNGIIPLSFTTATDIVHIGRNEFQTLMQLSSLIL